MLIPNDVMTIKDFTIDLILQYKSKGNHECILSTLKKDKIFIISSCKTVANSRHLNQVMAII